MDRIAVFVLTQFTFKTKQSFSSLHWNKEKQISIFIIECEVQANKRLNC